MCWQVPGPPDLRRHHTPQSRGSQARICPPSNKPTAASYTLVPRLPLWLAPTILGAYFMAREGIHWSEKIRDELGETGNES